MFKRHVIKELSSYLDNQLAEKEKLKVEAHLKDCAFCQQELSRLKLLSEKLKSWQVEEPGPFFVARVKDEIALQGAERGASKMKLKKWYIAVPSGVLAGILLLVFMSNVYVRRGLQARIRSGREIEGKQFDPSSGWQTGRNMVDKSVTRSMVMNGETVEMNEYDVHGPSKPDFHSFGPLEYSAKDKKPSYIAKVGAVGEIQRIDDLSGYDYIGGPGGQGGPDGVVSFGSHGSMGLERGGSRELAKVIPVEGQPLRSRGVYRGDYAEADAETEQVSSEGRPVIVIQPVLPATGIGDKIIRTAEVRLEVEDASIAYAKASEICQQLGGYLAASNFHKEDEGRQSGTITMRIPKEKFLDALNQINALGKVENSSTQSLDVSQEYANLKNQLETAMIVYNKMMDALQKRQVTIPEAMRLESELTPILRRVEALKNRIDYLNNAISFTTITVHFREPKVSLKALKESKQNIQKSMLAATIGAVKFLAAAVPTSIAVVIWLTIILVVALILKNWVTRLFKRK